MPRRLLLSETLDPDGALYRWMSPDVRALGWEVSVLPTQSAIHLLGPAGFADAAVTIASELRPDAMLVHPPYDHLPPASCSAIRALGTRLIALSFDDALFADLHLGAARSGGLLVTPVGGDEVAVPPAKLFHE